MYSSINFLTTKVALRCAVFCRKVQQLGVGKMRIFNTMFADKLKKVYTRSDNDSMVIEDIHIGNVKIESDGKKYLHKVKEI